MRRVSMTKCLQTSAGDYFVHDAQGAQTTRNCSMLAAKSVLHAGSGSSVQEINKLLKMHRQMADMMKKMSGKGGKGMMGKMASAMEYPEWEGVFPAAWAACLI